MSKLTNILRGFETLTSVLSKFLIGVCAIILFVMMVIISLEALLRYGFRASLVWPLEVTEYIMVGLAFLGLAYIQARGKHIKVDFIFNRFKPRAQVIITLFTSMVALFLFILVTIGGWLTTWEAWSLKVVSWSSMALPQFPVRGQVLIGAFVMCLYLLIELSRNIAALQGQGEVSEKESAPEIEIE